MLRIVLVGGWQSRIESLDFFWTLDFDCDNCLHQELQSAGDWSECVGDVGVWSDVRQDWPEEAVIVESVLELYLPGISASYPVDK